MRVATEWEEKEQSVRDSDADLDGRSVRLASDMHQSRFCFNVDVVAGVARVRTALTVAWRERGQ